MTTYYIERQIPSCNIDKVLLKYIEEYLIETLPRFLGLNSEINTNESKNYKHSVKITFIDKYGQETFSSIDSYKYPSLSNELESVLITYRLSDLNTALEADVRIKFSKIRAGSEIKISVNATNAREKADGVYQGLNHIFLQNRNSNYLLHPTSTVSTIFGSIFSLILTIPFFISAPSKLVLYRWIGLLSTYIAFLCIYYWLFRIFKPYVAFDTKAQKEKDKWFNWFILGVATFVLFGTILVVVRRMFLGF